MKRTPFVLLLSFGLVAALAAPAFAWQFAVVDSVDSDAPPTSLGVSSSNTIYVAWDKNGGDELWSAQWTGSAWTKTKVRSVIGVDCYDDAVGPVVGFKPGKGERIASACNDAQGGDLYWSSHDSSWTTTTVGSLPLPYPHIGFYANLDVCFDPSTKEPTILFGDTNGEYVARFYHSAGSWFEQDVTTPHDIGTGLDGPAVSCAYNPITGTLSVAYIRHRYEGTVLSYGTYTGGVWSFSGLAITDALGIPSLAFAPDGSPWIAFQEGSSTASHLEVGHLSGSSWTFTAVDSNSTVAGVAPSAAFTGSKLRVASYDQTAGNLRWASLSGSTWAVKNLETTNNVGNYPSLAFTSTASAYISYWDATKKDVRWARPS